MYVPLNFNWFLFDVGPLPVALLSSVLLIINHCSRSPIFLSDSFICMPFYVVYINHLHTSVNISFELAISLRYTCFFPLLYSLSSQIFPCRFINAYFVYKFFELYINYKLPVSRGRDAGHVSRILSSLECVLEFFASLLTWQSITQLLTQQITNQSNSLLAGALVPKEIHVSALSNLELLSIATK